MDIYDYSAQQRPQYPENSRAVHILVLGILSLTCGGLITGIPAWIIGSSDLHKIDEHRVNPAFKTETKVGMILGIIGTAGSIFLFMFFAGILLVGSLHHNVVTANRKAVNRDLRNIAEMAQEYYKRPHSLGGGEGSYKKFSIPYRMRSNVDGTYSAAVYDQEVIVTGTGVQKGYDGTFILHEIVIAPDTVFIRRLN